jgi:mRNA interferase RelE/StbE
VYKIRLPDDVAGLLRGLHPNLKRKVRAALRILLRSPFEGKSLRDDFEGLRSYRIGRFRIVYRISAKKHIEVVAIGPRKRLYEETLKILKRENNKRSQI